MRASFTTRAGDEGPGSALRAGPARPSRADRRWTDEEDALLEDLLGSRPTYILASRLGRTTYALWRRMHEKEISPYTCDGRYTASELARILDVHVNTVIGWCRGGYVRAERVPGRGRAGIWRIEWDATRPLPIRAPRLGTTMRDLAARGRVVFERVQAQKLAVMHSGQDTGGCGDEGREM